MRAHGPDGRVWDVARRPEPQRPLAGLLPGTTWLVEARAGDETRMWRASSRGDATRLVSAVAMAIRTGGPSPAGELDRDAVGTRAADDDHGDAASS
jgi:hypothetical protein